MKCALLQQTTHYLNSDDISFFNEAFKDPASEGINVRIYLPDRPLFDDVTEKDGMVMVSRSQTLLDLAGLGYRGKDLTLAMMENLRRP